MSSKRKDQLFLTKEAKSLLMKIAIKTFASIILRELKAKQR